MNTSPYDPPRTVIPVPVSPSPWMRALRHPTLRALQLLGTSVLLSAFALYLSETSFALGGSQATRHVVTAGLGLATVVAVLGTASGIWGTVLIGQGAAKGKAFLTLGSLAVSGMNAFLTYVTFLVTLMSTSDFRRGRQLRRFGKVLLPPVERGLAWADLSFVGQMEEAKVTAAQWRENGRTEHASVAAFAALTTELMALGAPPEMLVAAQRDALDEIRHTQLCFSLARALDGQDAGPGPFPEARGGRGVDLGRGFALARLGADSLVDGALHEGVSARVIAKLARRCAIEPISAMLREIARDEGRHAAHGWDVVLWCVAQGGDSVVSSLESALAALPHTMLSPLPPEAAAGNWERFGIHGHALEQEEYRAARADLVQRVASLRSSLATGRAA